MLPLKPEPLVATAIALASWEYQRNTGVEHDRASADAKRPDASLRFVHFAGFWSHYDPESRLSSWPLRRSIGITDLAGYVEQHHRLESRPDTGDVFLLANYDASRHVRAGIIASVEEVRTMLNDTPEFVCTTIEGELSALDATRVRPGSAYPRGPRDARPTLTPAAIMTCATKAAAPLDARPRLVIEDLCAPSNPRASWRPALERATPLHRRRRSSR